MELGGFLPRCETSTQLNAVALPLAQQDSAIALGMLRLADHKLAIRSSGDGFKITIEGSGPIGYLWVWPSQFVPTMEHQPANCTHVAQGQQGRFRFLPFAFLRREATWRVQV